MSALDFLCGLSGETDRALRLLEASNGSGSASLVAGLSRDTRYSSKTRPLSDAARAWDCQDRVRSISDADLSIAARSAGASKEFHEAAKWERASSFERCCGGLIP